MPYPFPLPTTSSLAFQTCISSATHPSLPLAITTQRASLRGVLKKHKRLPFQAQASHLTEVLHAFECYIPCLFAIDAGLCGRPVNGEEVDILLEKEVEVEWRSSVAPTAPGREAARVKGKGSDYELACTLSAFASTFTLLARSQLVLLYGTITPTAEQRLSIITKATKHLLNACSIHAYLSTRCSENVSMSSIPEMTSSVQGGLAALAIAEATILAVLKDDPYPTVVAQARNKNDKEWMIKPPEIPKVRAHLFARLCLAAAERAGNAESMFEASGQKARVDEALVKYARNLKRTSRAKACRFFGIDADLGGETGKGIAWLNGGASELGLGKSHAEGSKLQGLVKFKKEWTEKREDKKIEKGGEWGNDGGRFEEARVLDMLKTKWNKVNDTINTQAVPSSAPLIANMPSGRDIHSVKPYIPPALEVDKLAEMRALPDLIESADADEDSSSDDDGAKQRNTLPGAFPGGSTTGQGESYY